MICPKCETEISVEHNYCHRCGENLMGRCPCGEKDFNKAVNLCEKKLKQAQEEEIKTNEKINKLQGMFNSSITTVFSIVLLVPLISLFIFNETINILIPLIAGGALLWVVYVVLRGKEEKILKNFAGRHPEYYAAKYEK